MKESMRVSTESGVVDIILKAEHEDDMKNLREELFNWYEDFVERETSDGRTVVTTNAPTFETKRDKYKVNKIEETLCMLRALLEEADMPEDGGQLTIVRVKPSSFHFVLKSAIDDICEILSREYPF